MKYTISWNYREVEYDYDRGAVYIENSYVSFEWLSIKFGTKGKWVLLVDSLAYKSQRL